MAEFNRANLIKRDGTSIIPVRPGDTFGVTNNTREVNSLDLAQAIYDKCDDARLIMVADSVPGGELITNGQDWTGATGATPPDNWSPATAGIFTIISDGGPSGDNCLKLEVNATPNTNPRLYHSFTAVVGQEYTLSFWCKYTSGTGCLIKCGSTTAGGEYYNSGYLTDAVWTYHQFTFIPTMTLVRFTISTVSGTIGHFCEFDNISCTLTCEDYSSKGHNGVFKGAMTSDDRVDRGSVFMYDPDGTDDYIDFGDDDDFSFGDGTDDSAFSVGMVFDNVSSANKVLLSKWLESAGSESREWLFYVQNNNTIQLILYDESANVTPRRTTDEAITQGMFFVVATYDGGGGATAANGISIYVNGVLVSSAATNSGSYVAMESLASPMFMGAYMTDIIVNPFDGDVGAVFLDASEWPAEKVWSMWLQVKGKYGL